MLNSLGALQQMQKYSRRRHFKAPGSPKVPQCSRWERKAFLRWRTDWLKTCRQYIKAWNEQHGKTLKVPR